MQRLGRISFLVLFYFLFFFFPAQCSFFFFFGKRESVREGGGGVEFSVAMVVRVSVFGAADCIFRHSFAIFSQNLRIGCGI